MIPAIITKMSTEEFLQCVPQSKEPIAKEIYLLQILPREKSPMARLTGSAAKNKLFLFVDHQETDHQSVIIRYCEQMTITDPQFKHLLPRYQFTEDRAYVTRERFSAVMSDILTQSFEIRYQPYDL